MIMEFIFGVVAIYLFCGILFAIAFIFKGVRMVDEGAHNASLGFKIIIIPGTIIFWPVLLRKWVGALKKEDHD